ncbi:hypothetical protein D3C80_868970 [compost metagenome]|nr:hypothetical protein [Pseudomonas sp. 5]KJK05952.1 hypothetical protein UB47_18740 [Pseudomonas sp. 5]
MLTHKQQSFLATLWLNDQPINTLDTLTGKAAWVNRLGGAGVLPQLASTVRNDSHMLSCQAGISKKPMLFYFRQTPAGYRLYVREPGDHFGKGVWVHDHSHLGVVSTDQNDPSAFALRSSEGQIVSLSDLAGDEHQITLTHNGLSVSKGRRSNSPYEYLKTRGDLSTVWTLKVLERSVPWLSSPYEI